MNKFFFFFFFLTLPCTKLDAQYKSYPFVLEGSVYHIPAHVSFIYSHNNFSDEKPKKNIIGNVYDQVGYEEGFPRAMLGNKRYTLQEALDRKFISITDSIILFDAEDDDAANCCKVADYLIKNNTDSLLEIFVTVDISIGSKQDKGRLEEFDHYRFRQWQITTYSWDAAFELSSEPSKVASFLKQYGGLLLRNGLLTDSTKMDTISYAANRVRLLKAWGYGQLVISWEDFDFVHLLKQKEQLNAIVRAGHMKAGWLGYSEAEGQSYYVIDTGFFAKPLSFTTADSLKDMLDNWAGKTKLLFYTPSFGQMLKYLNRSDAKKFTSSYPSRLVYLYGADNGLVESSGGIRMEEVGTKESLRINSSAIEKHFDGQNNLTQDYFAGLFDTEMDSIAIKSCVVGVKDHKLGNGYDYQVNVCYSYTGLGAEMKIKLWSQQYFSEQYQPATNYIQFLEHRMKELCNSKDEISMADVYYRARIEADTKFPEIHKLFRIEVTLSN